MADPTDFEHWSPDAQRRALDMRNTGASKWRPFYCPLPACDGRPHGTWKWPHARADQRPPLTDWLVWAIVGGRGSGKTRTGTEWMIRNAKKNAGIRIALVAATGTDIRDTLVEGESGILAKSPPGFLPQWEPSKRRLTWPNGTTAYGYSGEEPDRLRGPQHHKAWVDEGPHYPLIDEVWSNLLFGLRLGRKPQVLLSTTPLPTKWLKGVLKDEHTVRTSASTYDNITNLPPLFAKVVLDRYEGTRLGAQEIYGKISSEVEGALWKQAMIDDNRITLDELPELDSINVGIDPAGTSTRKSDETGIVVTGVAGEEFYVLEDASGHYSPSGWAQRATGLYEKWDADCIVVEVTYGREMVTSTLKSVESDARVVPVDSRRGKVIRADPVVAKYEQGHVHHVGVLEDLEDQQCSWKPGNSSPDRLDALVHSVRYNMRRNKPADVSSPFDVLGITNRDIIDLSRYRNYRSA